MLKIRLKLRKQRKYLKGAKRAAPFSREIWENSCALWSPADSRTKDRQAQTQELGGLDGVQLDMRVKCSLRLGMQANLKVCLPWKMELRWD